MSVISQYEFGMDDDCSWHLGIQQQEAPSAGMRPFCAHEFVSTAVGIVMQTHVVFPRLPGVSFSSRVPHMGKDK